MQPYHDNRPSARRLTILYRNEQAVLRLLCFPYAGGSEGLYRFFCEVLPAPLLERLEILAVDYPGHGARRGLERPAGDFSELVHTLADAVAPLFAAGEVALLGCSLGAILGFEVARSIRTSFNWRPCHLYMVSCAAPQFPVRCPDLSDAQTLASYLRGLGSPVDEKEIDRRWPWYQGVYGLASTYRYQGDLPLLDCPITTFGGVRDSSIGMEELLGWRVQTSGSFAFHLVDGQHVFLRQLDFLRPLTRHLSQNLGLHLQQEKEECYAYPA
jgi:medium-chain acyl-[acyl-carrier-protein] hydrolase